MSKLYPFFSMGLSVRVTVFTIWRWTIRAKKTSTVYKAM